MVRFLFLLLCATPILARNVTELGAYDPPGLAHYQDIVFTGGATAYVSGSGGFSILSLSNLTAPTRTGHLARPSTEPLPNCAVFSSRALVCAQEVGVHVVNITNPNSPSLVRTFATAYSVEDAAFVDLQTAICALGPSGIGVLSLTTPSNPSWLGIYTQGITDARAIALSANLQHVYVADGNGLVVYSRSGSNLTYVSNLPLSGTSVDLQLGGNRAYLARGNSGISVVDITNPESLQLLGEFSTSGLASKISVTGTLIAVANWEDFEIYDATDPANVALAGFRYTPQRAMCVAFRGDTILCGDWGIFRTYRYGVISGPDLEVVPREVHFPATNPGSSRNETLLFTNFGGQSVVFSGFALPHPDYELTVNSNPLAPGDTVLGTLTYTPSPDSGGTTTLQIQSNDGDEPNLRINLTGNPPPGGVSVGNAAPDFTLPIYGGGSWTLSQHRGRIVVMCFFASW